MLIHNDVRQNQVEEDEEVYTFNREEGMWYIHMPRYLERGWEKKDLQMAEGAHKFLNVLSNGTGKVRLRLSVQPQKGAGVLKLVEHCHAPKGGAIYLYMPPNGQSNSSLFWICDLALFVFGDMPNCIYVQCVPAKKTSIQSSH